MVSDYIPAVALLLASLCISVYAMAHVRAPLHDELQDSKNQIAVLFPLGNSFEQNMNMAAASNSHIVRVGASDHILILEPQSAQSTEMLYNKGALAIFNPSVTGGCFASPISTPAFSPIPLTVSGAL